MPRLDMTCALQVIKKSSQKTQARRSSLKVGVELLGSTRVLRMAGWGNTQHGLFVEAMVSSGVQCGLGREQPRLPGPFRTIAATAGTAAATPYSCAAAPTARCKGGANCARCAALGPPRRPSSRR
jgi:hypothetical protein